MNEQVDTEITEKRGPGRPRKSLTTVTSRRSIALAKRLGPGGNIYGSGSKAIPMAEPGWKQKWFNSEYHSNRLYEAVHERGWIPVTPDDLSAKPEELGLVVNSLGHVARGAKAEEVLFKMDAEDYKEVERRKTEANNREIGRPGAVKNNIANALGNTFGDESGQFAKDNFVGNVVDSRSPLL